MLYKTLNNGVKMPVLGYGVFQIKPEDTKSCVLDALSVGYRSIDTAQMYHNEIQVGQAIKESNISREDIFLTTKIWFSNCGYEKAKASIEASLRRLDTDYIDLMLIHQPFGDYYGAYHAMEDAYREGKIRAIGVGNFPVDRFIDLVNFVDIKPVMNQIEMHVFNQQNELRNYMKKYDVDLTACEPLAQGKNGLFVNETLIKIGNKYQKTPAQIALKFLLQSDVIVIPKSVHKERMQENIDIFDFEMNEEEINSIKLLDLGKTQFVDKRDPEIVEMFMKFKDRKV